MKHQYLILLSTILPSLVIAQIPSGYYDSANGLTGFELKTELKTIITTGYITRDYDQLYDGNGISGSNGYIDTHSDVFVSQGTNYENDGTILDFYSEIPDATDPYNYNHGSNQCGNQDAEGDCYNREHLVPQSAFNSAFPMQSDIHHVIPTDGRVNNFRGSLVFGIVDVADFTSLNGSKRGTSAVDGYAGMVFEPLDEFKGDIARALLYFAVRYEDTVSNYVSFEMFDGTQDQVFFPWAIDLLLDWHYNVDPVDQRERLRNESAYAFQNNANPFVDHPEYAELIWGESNSVPSNDLFLSEYVEGTSNNKAIEVANFTGVPVSLSSYSIARDVNSNGSWGPPLQLSGVLPNEDVHVIVRGNADTELTNLSDQLSSGDAMSFNGDDPIGLFKNGVLIDVFGNFGGSNSFSNATYKRKEDVVNPTTSFNLSEEWENYPVNTFDDLGFHNQTLSSIDATFSNLNIFPNPLQGRRLYLNSKEEVQYMLFNVLGQLQCKGITSNGQINLPRLKSGLYILKLRGDNKSVSKKLMLVD